MKKKQEQEQAQEQQRRPEPKKSAKAQAREQKIKDEALELSLSIKEVYRKLAAQLHPDREQDLTERARKTALMQRINEAYDKADLLQLLELQLETEQIDQTMLNSVNTERLKTYNKVFNEQLIILKQEIGDVQFGFRLRFNCRTEASLKPAYLMRDLQHDIADMQEKVASIQSDLELLHDKKALKIWLKSYEKFPKFDNILIYR